MWRNTVSISSAQLRDFETRFKFKIDPIMREYLIDNNSGHIADGSFQTTSRMRRLERFLNFADRNSPDGAWSINERLRPVIGKNRIIIGIDVTGNYVCLEKSGSKQQIVVWSHITGDFEQSLLDIPALLRTL